MSPIFRRLAVLVLVVMVASSVSAESLAFSEMYLSSVLGTKFSPKLTSLAGKEASVTGFMAPPLRAEGNFFVLTRQPVSLCPFCNSDSDWPTDILVVYLKADQTFVQLNRPLVVTGRLELGSYTDPKTGFVSQVRLVDANFKEK